MATKDQMLVVYFGKTPMGELLRLRGGRLSFRYLDAYLRDPDAAPISLSMPPLDNATYGDDKVSPFLWNRLPDNELILQRWARRFHFSASNCFALLQAIGEDCAGAIRCMAPDQAAQDPERSVRGRTTSWNH